MIGSAANVADSGGGARSTGARLRRLALILVVLAPLGVALDNGFPVCPSAGLFGLPCPGCGLTRATLLLIQGRFAAAFAIHPLVFPLAPLYFGAMGALLLDFVRGPNLTAIKSPSWLTRPWVTGAALALLLTCMAVWAARFVGFAGGPAPVESYRSWAEHQLL